MALFKHKYRIESTRLPNWNYAAPGYYFVTICTRGRKCFFGEVIKDELRLSGIGEIVAEEWLKTEKVRTNVQLDCWGIMPNHIHGIVVISHPPAPRIVEKGSLTAENSDWLQETPHRGVTTKCPNARETPHRGVSTIPVANWVQETPHRGAATISVATLKANSLGSIIGQFKSVCTKRIRAVGFSDFAWQPRFHESVIDDEESLNNIREYISNNPRNWESDEENPKNPRR